MKKAAFVIYRSWAYDIYTSIVAYQQKSHVFEIPLLITTPQAEFPLSDGEASPNVHVLDGSDYEKIAELLSDYDIDVVFFYGWSWFVKEPTLSNHICLCLHPSPLPRYRGGSPIQNQILAGETESAVSVFKMSEGIDDGDIYKQNPISLDGSLVDIFSRMTQAGILLTQDFILNLVSDNIVFVPQKDINLYQPLKRRTKEQSEIPLEKLTMMTYVEFYNMVRALADPYPNAYIILNENHIFLQEVKKVDSIPEGGYVINEGKIDSDRPLYVRLSDGYAEIVRFRTGRPEML